MNSALKIGLGVFLIFVLGACHKGGTSGPATTAASRIVKTDPGHPEYNEYYALKYNSDGTLHEINGEGRDIVFSYYPGYVIAHTSLQISGSYTEYDSTLLDKSGNPTASMHIDATGTTSWAYFTYNTLGQFVSSSSTSSTYNRYLTWSSGNVVQENFDTYGYDNTKPAQVWDRAVIEELLVGTFDDAPEHPRMGNLKPANKNLLVSMGDYVKYKYEWDGSGRISKIYENDDPSEPYIWEISY